MGDVGFLLVWMLGCVAFTVYGYYALQASRDETARFKKLGTTMFGERFANFVYREEGIRLAARGFLIGGPIFFLLGVATLILVLVRGG